MARVLLLTKAHLPDFALRPVAWRGLTLAVENEAGSLRSGTGPDGTTWATIMPFPYGYAIDSEGVDGDEVDIVIGPELETAENVYIIHQRRAGDWERYDEDKCFLGFLDEASARAVFLQMYDDPRFLGPITTMPVDEFVRKVKATRRRPQMIKAVLFFKARDRHDSGTPDLFGTHLETITRKDGVVQGYHVSNAEAPAADSGKLFATANTSEKPNADVPKMSNNAPMANESMEAKEPAAFNPSAFVAIAADDASKLRKDDVFRLFEEVPREHIEALRSYLYNARPDLDSVVQEAIDEVAPPQEFKLPNTREVPEWMVPHVQAKVDKVNKRATKLGVEGFKLTQGTPFKRRISKQDEWPERFAMFVPLTIEGPVIKAVGGWDLQGRVDFEDGGILVNARPGHQLPPRYRSISPTCDHCKSDRQRNAVFVFQDPDGEYMQVGRQCLQDFMGKNPEAVLWAAREFSSIFDDIDEELGRDGGERTPDLISLKDVLAAAALAVRLKGFTSRKMADERGGISTSEDVFTILFPPKNPKEKPPVPEDVDREKAQAVIDWVQNTWGVKSDQSDYEYNAVELTSRDTVRLRRIGLLTSLIAAYNRAMEADVERKKRVNAHVGTVGERRDFVATYAGENWFDTDFGSMVIARFDSPEGLLVYKGSKPFWPDTIKAGDEIKFTGTIKKHDDYKGTKQTIVQRCVLTKEKPPKPAKAPKKPVALLKPAPAPKANGAQLGEFFHGTPLPFDKFREPEGSDRDRGAGYEHQGRAVYLTDDPHGYARFFARESGARLALRLDIQGKKQESDAIADSWGTIMSVKLADDAKILDLESAPKAIKELFQRSVGDKKVGQQLRDAVLAAGYDGLVFREPNFPEGWEVRNGARTVALYNQDKAVIVGHRDANSYRLPAGWTESVKQS